MSKIEDRRNGIQFANKISQNFLVFTMFEDMWKIPFVKRDRLTLNLQFTFYDSSLLTNMHFDYWFRSPSPPFTKQAHLIITARKHGSENSLNRSHIFTHSFVDGRCEFKFSSLAKTFQEEGKL